MGLRRTMMRSVAAIVTRPNDRTATSLDSSLKLLARQDYKLA